MMASVEPITAILVAAVLLGWARLGWWQWRARPRAAWWRIAALALLQTVVAALLHLTLLPPARGGGSETPVVATGGAARLIAVAPGERLVALPEARVTGAEAAPDLATALRRHPGVARLRILGGGLTARDRPAAASLPLAFAPPAPPRGIAGLYPPGPVAPGAAFSVGVAAAGVTGGWAELLDPAGRLVDRARVAEGPVQLGAAARGAGAALFTVRLRDAADAPVETASVPVEVIAPPPTRLLIVAGAPGPEVKYLRRWATDAGLAPLVRLGVGGGTGLGDALPLTPATLARIDVAVFDARGWAALSGSERQAVAAAVRGGMGALLRITEPVPPAVRSSWRAMGLDVAGGATTAPLTLAAEGPGEAALQARRGPGTDDTPATSAGPRDELPVLTRRLVTMPGAAPLLTDAKAGALGGWREAGAGRVGMWPVEDGFALVTAGHGDRYGEWWSAILSRLARPDARPRAAVPRLSFAGERMAICDLPPGAGAVTDPAGGRTTLVPDRAAGGCAGYWPARAGWHRLGSRQPFFVQAADALPAARAAERAEATRRLISNAPAAAPQGEPVPGSPWPWFIAWLAAAALLWWLERAKAGRQAGWPPPPVAP